MLLLTATLFCQSAFAVNFEKTMAKDGVTLVELTGKPVETTGEAAEIIKRAQACVLKTFASGKNQGIDRSTDAAPMFEINDPASGQLTFKAWAKDVGFIETTGQARFAVEAKDRKFRILLSALRNKGIGDLVLAWGTRGDVALAALTKASADLEACVLTPSTDW